MFVYFPLILEWTNCSNLLFKGDRDYYTYVRCPFIVFSGKPCCTCIYPSSPPLWILPVDKFLETERENVHMWNSLMEHRDKGEGEGRRKVIQQKMQEGMFGVKASVERGHMFVTSSLLFLFFCSKRTFKFASSPHFLLDGDPGRRNLEINITQSC